MNRRWIHIIFMIMLSACVKEAAWEDPENGMSYIVVDGIMTNEYKVQSVYLHHNKSGLNDAALPVSGAEVIISNEVIISGSNITFYI